MTVTLEELAGLSSGEIVDITIKDVDGVEPQHRGKTLRCTLQDLDIKIDKTPDLLDNVMLTAYGHEPIIVSHTVGTQQGSHVIERPLYGFHGWLIESVERMAP